jgi:signal transduction histidine kinase/CheY-like chemotaxis protein
MSLRLLTVRVHYEHDVVVARQRARQIADALGFDVKDQTRIATAVSEIGRNAFTYAGGGTVEFVVEGQTPPQVLLVRVSDTGRGIADLQRILDGEYQSTTGMGLGIVGTRRLMDQFHIESAPGRGTTVLLRKLFPPRAPTIDARAAAGIADRVARQRPSAQSLLEEVQQQNQELLRMLDELRTRQDELTRLNLELEDTNRGVVALYAELDEKADHLRRADELKSRFLSNMSHEFRTPVNSIIALSRLLLDRADGPLTVEQERQLGFVRRAAEDLSELVNDLLDLAKVEAGKIVVRPTEFEVANLFGALRGMLRPLLVAESVSLVFEEPDGIPALYTDEGKVSQILRNFLSNALKFTERGEVRVSARLTPEGDAVRFAVADTGIGIAPEDRERIFEEFGQLDHPVQRRVKGTGLGLPLSRKLAELLGGRITVESTVGQGSTFALTVPVVYAPTAADLQAEPAWDLDPGRLPVLVVEDSPETVLLYERLLRGSRYQVVPARSVREAQQALRAAQIRAIVLDILLKGEDTWTFLASLKEAPATRDIPVLVVTTVEDRAKAFALGADAYGVKPVAQGWLVGELSRLIGRSGKRVLVIDDDEVSRYLVRQAVRDPAHAVLEATGGVDGLRQARDAQPDVIVLDLVMPDISGFEVLERLKADPATCAIPVVVVTSKDLNGEERGRLARHEVEVLSKAAVARRDATPSVRDALARRGIG